jgi:hypothetical protein
MTMILLVDVFNAARRGEMGADAVGYCLRVASTRGDDCAVYANAAEILEKERAVAGLESGLP